MKTETHPLVRDYLATVEREAAALPTDRRNELLADLAEHIDASAPEGSAPDADAIRALLHELGDPRTIVAAALREEPAAPPRGLGRPFAAIVLLAGSVLLCPTALPVAALLWLVGLRLLWRAPYWSTREKQVATAVTGLPVAVGVLWMLGVIASGNVGPMEVLLLAIGMVAVPAFVAVFLFRAARRRLG